MAKAKTVDEYIGSFPEPTRSRLVQMRAHLRKLLPDAEETISYAIPTYRLYGKNVVHFGGFDHHTGFYPTPTGVEEFKVELAAYKQGKGSVQFPHDKPLPLDLIGRIVEFQKKKATEKHKR